MDPLLVEIKRVMLREIGELVRIEATGLMKSRTLRENIETRIEIGEPGDVDRVVMHLPFYWAKYVHDGRDSIELPAGKYMTFFPNVRDDPRVDGGANYPRERGDRRSLTSEEFKRFSKINYENRKLGLPPIMVVTEVVGPFEGEHFFDLAWELVSSSGVADQIVAASLQSYLESALTDLDSGNVAIDL